MESNKLRWFLIMPIISISGITLAISYIYRRKVVHSVWALRSRAFMRRKKDVFMVSNHQQWAEISDPFCSIAKNVGAIGFDCEWTQVKGSRRPVALMQLATHSGMCALIRLNHMKTDLPTSLKELLENKKILKVGVGPDNDKQYLMNDHNIIVKGCVDLRHLAIKSNLRELTCQNQMSNEKLGLQALTIKHLKRKLNKDWRVRMSDWEADVLSNIQKNYASEDALVGIHILLCLLENLWNPSSTSWPPFRMNQWENLTLRAVEEICCEFAEVKFMQRSSVENVPSMKKRLGLTLPLSRPLKEGRNSYSTRKTPLYHNSQLWAPDGEPLCTCDPQKAYWYVTKGLGVLISEDPLIVRLNFEPAGRPNREGIDGQFYLQERHNICVVCGKDESYIRKNIIPHEYRKYFPEILKAHQSHDVVLLCVECHQVSNIRDNSLRYKLAEEFNAPIGCETDVKVSVDGKLKAVRSAGGALKKNRHMLPPERIHYLQNILKEYFQTENLTIEHINNAANLDVQIVNDSYIPHGYKVYQEYRLIGLIQLEERWRQWFLDSMNPKYLPDNWSISHNHKKLKVKMSRYPLDHPLREDYKIALVGNEGNIDVAYIPQTHRNLDEPENFFPLDFAEESNEHFAN